MPKTKVEQRLEINLIPMSGSSSSIAVSHPATEHDVFLSFRGEDTRDGFTSHLYAAFRRNNIETYIDDRLVRGDEISPALQKAIEESMIYVIIFSENYASSRWCLDELTKILECKERCGRAVIPVFYKVDPSNVRHQRGSYADAFVKHEERFMDKVKGWKAALTEAAGLSGWDSQTIRPESKLVEDIVNDILRKLDSSPVSDCEGLIGIHKHIEQIQSMLDVESAAVRIIGIWGMGGIGKTTIAGALYHKLANQFSCSTFVVNVQEEIERYGIHHIRSRYLSELLEQKMPASYLGLRSLNERLKRAKVLLVLDNVNNSVQLKDLIGGHGSFGLGSRIIVTSRDLQVLKNAETDKIYEVKEMDFQDSLLLFSLNAFKQNYPIETYIGLSEKVLNYAKGIPLALRVLGSFLYGRPREAWESELQKLEKLPDLETFNVLKLSYDGLDDEQKDIFLDIACFYRVHGMNILKRALDTYGLSAAIGMEVLFDRCLISILNHKIVMHDLIQGMGQEIVRQQCHNDPGKCSRLWKHKDIYDVLRKNKGTDAIQHIFLDICKIREVQLHAETFKMMHNLRSLQFYKSNTSQDSRVYIPVFVESLPDELRFLRWDGFPQISLPLDFCPENLIELDMHDSHLEQLWEGDQHLPNLKRLNLSGSQNLIQIPDLSQSPKIEEIILSHCKKLDVVYSSSFLSKLHCLWLDGCVGLRNLYLPSNILSRSSAIIVLSDCHNLEMFSVSNRTEGVLLHGCSRHELFRFPHPPKDQLPIVSGDKYKEEQLRDGTHFLLILALDLSRRCLASLCPGPRECWLDFSNCESLTSLPVELCKMKFLSKFYLRGCSNLEKFPEIDETVENLTMLNLDKTAIQELPSSLHNLVGLEKLSLFNCERLVAIPDSIGSLSKLRHLDVTSCESLETLPSSIFKLKLRKFDLHGCSMLRTFPEIMEPAESFKHLRLTKTAIKEIPSSLEYLVGLRTLRLNFCRHLKFLPNSIGHLSLLRELWLDGSGIVSLPESIAHLSSLKSLYLSDCKKLECIPELPPFLIYSFAFDCPSVRTVSSSKFKLLSDSNEGTFIFHLTNSQELDPSAHSNIVADARVRILHDAYRCVIFCFPGSAVPHWFPYRCKGWSVTLNKDSLNCCTDNDNRFIGFALCVVLGLEGMDDEEGRYSAFSYRFRFESDDGTHIIPNPDELGYYFLNWHKCRERFVVQDHTFVWKCYLEATSVNYILSHAHNFTFEIGEYDDEFLQSYYEPDFTIKECGICPLYSKEKDDNAGAGDYSNFLRFSNNDNEDRGQSCIIPCMETKEDGEEEEDWWEEEEDW